jgi:hypothetical protein
LGRTMTVGSIALDMSTRIPWDVAKRIFVLNEIPRAHGWDKTIERVGSHEGEFYDRVDALSHALQEHYIAGEKLSRFYKLTAKEARELRKALLETKPAKKAATLTSWSEGRTTMFGSPKPRSISASTSGSIRASNNW